MRDLDHAINYMSNFFLRGLIFSLISFQCFAAFENQVAMLDFEEDFLDELPIVLSATRLAQPQLESAAATTIINRRMIEASGARTIPDILRLVPGFQVGYFDGNSPVATYHGHSGELNTRLQVLIDGRSVYLPSRNAVPWSDLIISIDNIEKIEITRGPNAATFGSNSFLAVINITTLHSTETQDHYARLSAGSFNTADALYQFGSHMGRMEYRFTMGTQNNDGTRFLNDYTKNKFFKYRIDYQHSIDDNISYQGGYKDITLGDHEPSPNFDPSAGHDILNTSAFQHIKWEHQINTSDSIRLQYYYNLNKSLEIASLGVFGPESFGMPAGSFDDYEAFFNINVQSERHDLELSHYINPLDNVRIVWGGSLRLDIVNADDTLFDTPGWQSLNMSRGFANVEWRINQQWIVNSGIMVEDNDISGNSSSPRLAIIYKISPKQSIRFNHAEASRTPTLFEEAGRIIFTQDITIGGQAIPETNPLSALSPLVFTRLLTPGNLRAERIINHEIGYYAQLANNTLQFDIKAFSDKTFDLLDITAGSPVGGNDLNTGPIELIENANSTKTQGTELSINYQINNNLNLYAFYSKINIEHNFIADTAESRYDKTAPKSSGGIMLNKHWDNGINSSLIYYNVGDMDWTDRTGIESAQAYTKLDIRIAKTFRSGNTQLDIALTGQNLYESFSDYNNRTLNSDGSVNNTGAPQERKFFIDIRLSF